MMDAADKLDYERAATLRDQIKRLERHMFGMDSARPPAPTSPPGTAHRNERDEVHGRLDRRKTKGAGNKSSQPPARGGRALASPGPAKAKAGVRQGKLKLVPDDRK
jgi:hypothetical protein